jgi:hypothetical protein
MYDLFQRLLNLATRVWQILIDKVPPGQWSWVYRAIHWLGVVLITALLAIYSDNILGNRRVNLTAPIVILERYYCGFVFAAGYAFVRTVIFAIGLFGRRDTSEFPDIDDAWDHALLALDRLGFDIRDVPLFAVVGTTPATEAEFFSSIGIEWKAIVPPRETDSQSCLRLYLDEKACFVALSNVGAYARQLVNPEAAVHDVAPQGIRPGGMLETFGAVLPKSNPSSAMPTMTPQQFAMISQGNKPETASPRQPSYSGLRTMLPGMMDHPQQTWSPAQASGPAPTALPAPLEQSQTALGLRRLNYFLKLLSADREPFCGINGLLSVLPVRWTASSTSLELLSSLKADLHQFQTVLRQSFPVVALLSDIESLPGFRAFLNRMRRIDLRVEDKTRAGTRCPMGTVMDRKHSEWVIDKSVDWFRDWIFRLFAVTTQDNQRDEGYQGLDDASNRDLYSLLCTLQKHRTTLWRQLELVFSPQGELPLRVSGYYFAAKGPSRAFLRGVLQKLEDEQNEVAYFPSSCRRDKRLKTCAMLAVLCGLAFLIADGYLAWELYRKFS